MGVPSSVLVAVDFGDASARAVAVGGFIADRCHATLRLLHADTMEAPAYFTQEQIARLERQQHEMQAQADQFVTRFGRQHTKIPFATVIRNGPPVDAILHEAASADLVVMGTHGRRGPKRWWLGSVVERVLREIRRPLLVVRAEPGADDARVFAHAVVHAPAPLDGGAALALARAVAGCAGGTVFDNRGPAPHVDTAATLIVAAVPDPRSSPWLSRTGEPLLRSSDVPILFVPEMEAETTL